MGASGDESDRRSADRSEVQVGVEIADGKSVIEADTLNLSKTGAFIRTTKPVEIGQEVEISLSIPNHAFPIVVDGEVVRRDAFDDQTGIFAVPGLGIKFKNLGEEAEKALSLLTDEQAGQPAKPIHLPINLKVTYSSLASFANYYISDISKGGIYIETDTLMPIGTEFEFQMSVPGIPVSVKLLGKVMWVHDAAKDNSRASGMGIKFRYRNEMHQKMLEDIVNDHIKQSVA